MIDESSQAAAPLSMGHSAFLPNDEEPQRSGFRLGFVLGLLFGIALTLVFTPKTGEEMREEIKELSIVLKERAVGMMTGERPYEPGEDVL